MRTTHRSTNRVTIGIIFLVVIISVVYSPAYSQEKRPSPVSRTGNILYVGGSGPGNFTKIQDAINVSNPGDTVYVYSHSSPYYEHLVIQKSITVMGEDALTTEINGSMLNNSLDTVNITGDHVAVRNFRITENHGYYYQAALKIMGDDVTVSNCTVSRNEWIGIYLHGASFCTIRECEVNHNLVAMNLVGSKHNTIQNCRCLDNSDAITLYDASDMNSLMNCTCRRNSFDGIHIQQSFGNQITGCVCENGYDGISLAYAPHTSMYGNTMTNNVANFGIGSSLISDFYCDITTSNTINGKPLYYLIDQHNLRFDETIDVGFLGLVGCSNISVEHLAFANNFEGMLCANTSGSHIENCSFYNNEGHGMYMISSSNNTVKDCVFHQSFWDGIFLYNASGNTLENCSSTGSIAGVSLDSSPNNMMNRLSVTQCSIGISLDSSGGNTLKNTTLKHCGLKVAGISVFDYINDADTSNTVNGKPLYYCINDTNRTIPSDAGQVLLINCSYCNASSLNLSNASVGIELAYARGNTIAHNVLNHNSVVAIYLDGAHNDDNIIRDNLMRNNNYGVDVESSYANVLQNNLLSRNGLGFSLRSSQGNALVGNTVKDGSYGVYFDRCSLTTMTGNTIDNTSIFGMYLYASSGNTLRSNKMVNCSLLVYGAMLSEYINDVDTSNTVNGKRVYYILQQMGLVLPRDAGEVLLIGCSGCTVKNLNLDRGTVGITLAYSSKNNLIENTIQRQSQTAIDLGSGQNHNNTIQRNILLGNTYGIDIERSGGTIVKRNRIDSNSYGILLFHAMNTTLSRNTILRNLVGVNIVESSGSTVRFNNIFKDYFSGLFVDACSVCARWNWWGAATGPEGKGDRITVVNRGHVANTPWLPLPVLVAGNFRSHSTGNHHYSLLGGQPPTPSQRLTLDPLTSVDIMAMNEVRNPRLPLEQRIYPEAIREHRISPLIPKY